jgi:hypothetical protein
MAKPPTLQERIEQLGARLWAREKTRDVYQVNGHVVPDALREAIDRTRYDLELMRLVQAWADERAGWDPRTAVRHGGWTEAEAKLLAAARRGTR